MPSSDVARNPKETVVPLIRAWASEAEGILRGSALLSGLDIGNDDDSAEAVERLKDRTELPEFWALIVGIMELQLQESIGAGDAIGAAGAAVTIASARAMLKFKTDLEDVVWRGHSVEKLRTALRIWQDNQKNDSEEFWQNTLRAHSFILSQVFATPVVVIGSKAYVGGKTIDNTGGNLADFLLQNGLTAAAAIVELKTPTTQLLRKEYRNGVYPPSAELTGAVAQVGAYVSSLAEETTLRLQSEPRLEHARSEAVVIAGTASDELKDKDHRRSFELYRSELRTVRVVTYDEMFQRVQVLLTLFGG
jgi:hypothetical protein